MNFDSKTPFDRIIKDLGFHETIPCMCGGVKNRKYRKGIHVLYIRPTKQLFKLKRSNSEVIGLTKLSELETKLSEIFHVQEA